MTQQLQWHRFGSPSVFAVSGKDARRYLHARLTQDIKQLGVGQTCQAAALSPQGKVEAIFVVACVAESSFLLWSPCGLHEQLLQALRRFLVADRVSIEDASPRYALFHVHAEETALSALSTQLESNASLAKVRRLTSIGLDLLVSAEQLATVEEKLSRLGVPLTALEWNFTRARYGLPSFPEEVSPDLLLAEVHIPDIVSYTKGCYAGQEVVERLAAKGKPARLVLRYEFAGALPAQQERYVIVYADQDKQVEAGWLLSAYQGKAQAPGSDTTCGFALVRSAMVSQRNALRVKSGELRLPVQLIDIS